MIIAVGLLSILTLAIAGLVLLPRMRLVRIVFDSTPDAPAAFGYRMTWIAVRTDDPSAVLAALGVEPGESVNWRTGVGAIYDRDLSRDRVFISPVVAGWVFVAGDALPQPLGPRFADKVLPLLLNLGRGFPDVQYFSSHPALDYFAWARVQKSELVRAYAVGSDGQIWNSGKPTREERALGLKLFDVRGVKNRHGDAGEALIVVPTEAQVMALAGRWSLDPTRLQTSSAATELGRLVQSRQAWLPERFRKSA